MQLAARLNVQLSDGDLLVCHDLPEEPCYKARADGLDVEISNSYAKVHERCLLASGIDSFSLDRIVSLLLYPSGHRSRASNLYLRNHSIDSDRGVFSVAPT